MKTTLLIIDPQVDFITGTMAVQGAIQAMDYLVNWINEHEQDFQEIIVTQDWHPKEHCSFQANGGIWQEHCVAESKGAALYAPLQNKLDELSQTGFSICYLHKGCNKQQEEYSAFAKTLPVGIAEADRLYVAGIAGNYCVKCSVEDIEKHQYKGEIVKIQKAIPYI